MLHMFDKSKCNSIANSNSQINLSDVQSYFISNRATYRFRTHLPNKKVNVIKSNTFTYLLH